MNRLNKKIFQKRMLDWFQIHGRTLPWRKTRDPYAILVAEVMLQQTQVERVVPKYQAFMDFFPSLSALAEAPKAEVIRAWAGMGYNRRALFLQRAARFAVDQLGGRLPPDISSLRDLDGVGPYTAAAVACFAFNQQIPVLDTNVKRVLQRVFRGSQHLGSSVYLKLAVEALPEGQAWEWNQALMDLGATICKARNPRCNVCPVGPYCHAKQSFQELVSVAKANSTAQNKLVPFHGSSRYYRGRIVDWLRNTALTTTMDMEDLGRRLKSDYTQSDSPWRLGLLEGLERDGLVCMRREPNRVIVGLPMG